jgi:hypothetical protein
MSVLTTVISGGQTGADETGLECARALGFQTGGTAPKGYWTERGPNLKLRDVYGLKESPSSDYKVRTKQNVIDSHVTVWFGELNSPGYWCTRKAAEQVHKPFYTNPEYVELEYLLNEYPIWNIAGNRQSKNPDVVQLVRRAFGYVAEIREKSHANVSE